MTTGRQEGRRDALRCRFGLHRWVGGKRLDPVPFSMSPLTGTRVCSSCGKRQKFFWDSQGGAWETLRPAPLTVAAGMERDPVDGLPDDLAALLRDHSIIVPQDAGVFALIAKWATLPSNTASGLTVDEWREAWIYSTRRFRTAEDERDVLAARVPELEAALDELLDVATRIRTGDPDLDPERWYAARDYARKLLRAEEAPDGA